MQIVIDWSTTYSFPAMFLANPDPVFLNLSSWYFQLFLKQMFWLCVLKYWYNELVMQCNKLYFNYLPWLVYWWWFCRYHSRSHSLHRVIDVPVYNQINLQNYFELLKNPFLSFNWLFALNNNPPWYIHKRLTFIQIKRTQTFASKQIGIAALLFIFVSNRIFNNNNKIFYVFFYRFFFILWLK